ncbi:hypothetical protein CB1_000259015 [Camelus ferus]|nr:hypothetical protein CB1_000259015 [Camelus ferus]
MALRLTAVRPWKYTELCCSRDKETGSQRSTFICPFMAFVRLPDTFSLFALVGNKTAATGPTSSSPMVMMPGKLLQGGKGSVRAGTWEMCSGPRDTINDMEAMFP